MNEQNFWRIETQLKRLNKNDLQAIMDEFNNKIDSIFEKDCSDIEELRPKSKAYGLSATELQERNAIAAIRRQYELRSQMEAARGLVSTGTIGAYQGGASTNLLGF